VCDTDGVDEILPSASQLKAGPASVAVADSADLLVCGLELLGAGLNLGETDFLGVSTNLLGVRHAGIGRLKVH